MGTSSATTTTYHNFIDGAWVPSVSGDLFEDRNPANADEVVGVFQKSTAADVADAIDAARLAYERWRLVPAPKRAELLFRAAQLIADRKEALARDMTREMGKVLDEARGDVQEAIDMTFFMAGEGRRQYGQTVPAEMRDKFAMSVRQPMGVAAIITPWNFPMAIPSWKIIPALVCGNTVVFKPATLTPLSALNFVRILEEAGIPRGVVNLVTGGGGGAGAPGGRDEGGPVGRWRRRRHRDGRGRGGPHRVVHRIDRGRPHRVDARRAVVQEGPPRDGREERHPDHGRRESRARRRGLSLGRVRHQRPALHRRQ